MNVVFSVYLKFYVSFMEIHKALPSKHLGTVIQSTDGVLDHLRP